MADLIEQFRRYAAMVDLMLAAAPAFSPDAESATAVQVERGIVFTHALVDRDAPSVAAEPVERLIELSSPPERIDRLVVVDRSGHHRPVYRALLTYAWLQAYRLRYETLAGSQFGRWEEALRAWCDRIESDLGSLEWPTDVMPAGRGSTATEAAWGALALHVAGRIFIRDAWTDLAADTFGRIVKRQPGDGSFLRASGSDNPETRWYHELVTLHAAASYAVQAEDRTVASSVLRATDYMSAEIQPDHATNQPWALFAFVWNERTRPLADQLLHACATQLAGAGGVSLMLLADALYCLRLFTEPARKP